MMKDTTGVASIASEICNDVKNKIVVGDLPGGARITEEALAREFGTSRTPAREAIRRLAAEGFLVFKPNSGSFVRDWTPLEITEIFDLRLVLECEVSSLAAQRIREDELDRLRDIQLRQERLNHVQTTGDFDALSALNRDFHDAIGVASRNERMVATLAATIQLPIVQKTYRRYSLAQLRRSDHHHRELCDAMEARNPEWARAVMHCHIASARSVMIS
jgi:DNA-binding GntR family transcriptional regulator